MVIPDQETLSIESEIAEAEGRFTVSQMATEILRGLFKSPYAERMPMKFYTDESCGTETTDS